MSRPFYIAANWKMHKSPAEAVSYLKEFLPRVVELPKRNKVIFFVPALDLWVVQELLRDTVVGWGAQNCYFENQGAFTGENSPAVLRELLTPYTLVGHSERRAIFGETDEWIAKKFRALQDSGIEPMLCVGETLEDRDQGKTEEFIRRQLRQGLQGASLEKPFLLAYEPVWAIGTGRVATPEQANSAHRVLRDELEVIAGPACADRTAILYGGSVKPENAIEIAAQNEIDGFLVGGASLKVDSFLALAKVEKNS